MKAHKNTLQVLSQLVKINKARLNCLKYLVLGVIRHRTVNLTLLATSQASKATHSSQYRKLQRFFSDYHLPLEEIGHCILSQLVRPKTGWILTMDRTNWKFGRTHINILTIGVVVNKVAIPIVWKVLPQKSKRGNSHTSHRIEVMERILRLMDSSNIDLLLMDREFTGKNWLPWLDKQSIGYVLRVRKNTLIKGQKIQELFKGKQCNSVIAINIEGVELFFSYKKITQGRGGSLYVMSNKLRGKNALKSYKKRWAIELLFSHLKKRGFNLEDTHLTQANRLETLFAIVSLAFLCTFAWGHVLRSTRKNTSYSQRKSSFRLGLEDLLRILSFPPIEYTHLKSFPPPSLYSSIPAFFVV